MRIAPTAQHRGCTPCLQPSASHASWLGPPQVRTLREILERLRETYCGAIGYEVGIVCLLLAMFGDTGQLPHGVGCLAPAAAAAVAPAAAAVVAAAAAVL